MGYMKLYVRALILFWLLATMPVGAVSVRADEIVRIVFFSNMPEVEASDDRPGLARVASYIHQVRSETDNTFIIHGGDSLSPSVLSSLDRGAHMIHILNTIEPDVMAVAKREFAYGEDVLIQRAEEALFPLVSSNTLDQATHQPFEAISPSEIFDIGNVSIGIVVLTSPQLIEEYATKRTVLSNTVASAKQRAANLRSLGADILILTSDFELTNHSEITSGGLFDIIIQASTHNANVQNNKGTYFLAELGHANNLTDIHLSLTDSDDGLAIAELTVARPDLFAMTADNEIAEMIAQHVEPLARLMSTPIGRTTVKLSTIRNQVRSEENAFANMLTDSLRSAVGADIALINGGSIRGDTVYSAGSSLTRNNLQAELPFRNVVRVLQVTGQKIWDALQHGLPCRQEFDGCFPHVSNMEVVYSTSNQSLISAEVGGVPINPAQTYRLVTTEFLALGGDGYTMFETAPRLASESSGQLTREILSNYISEKGTIAPILEGRIEILD